MKCTFTVEIEFPDSVARDVAGEEPSVAAAWLGTWVADALSAADVANGGKLISAHVALVDRGTP